MHKGLTTFDQTSFLHKAVLNPQVLFVGRQLCTTWFARNILDDKDHDDVTMKRNQEQEWTNRVKYNRYPKDGNCWGIEVEEWLFNLAKSINIIAS